MFEFELIVSYGVDGLTSLKLTLTLLTDILDNQFEQIIHGKQFRFHLIGRKCGMTFSANHCQFAQGSSHRRKFAANNSDTFKLQMGGSNNGNRHCSNMTNKVEIFTGKPAGQWYGCGVSC